MRRETVFMMDSSRIKYGPGATREDGHDTKQLGAQRVLVVTDANLTASEPVSPALLADTVEQSTVQLALGLLSPAGRTYHASGYAM